MRNHRGAVLLEAVVALAVLAIAIVALVEGISAGLRAEQQARGREETLAAEERVLTAYALLAREDLDRRLGRRRIGELIVNVQRPEPTLYRIAVSNTETPKVEDLVTVVYRLQPVP